MASATALSLMAERAKAATPAREPTNASLPILGPPTAPIEHKFAPPPPLTPAQRAAQTRAQRAAGILPAKPEKAAKAPPTLLATRPDGVELVLRLAPCDQGMVCTLQIQKDGEATEHLSSEDRALVGISARATRDDSGDLAPANNVTFASAHATAETLALALPVMRRLDAALLGAYDETEDASFPQLVLTMAATLGVSRIETTMPDGSVISAKRGAAYIAAFKAGEAHKPA